MLFLSTGAHLRRGDSQKASCIVESFLHTPGGPECPSSTYLRGRMTVFSSYQVLSLCGAAVELHSTSIPHGLGTVNGFGSDRMTSMSWMEHVKRVCRKESVKKKSTFVLYYHNRPLNTVHLHFESNSAAILLGARTLLGAPGHTTRNKRTLLQLSFRASEITSLPMSDRRRSRGARDMQHARVRKNVRTRIGDFNQRI